ncbi:MAG: hypothetical protein KDI42_04185 [Gammaproteobacteria bacterium]|nr:hypothetical protein [Gammaproteobacteria bacterium]
MAALLCGLRPDLAAAGFDVRFAGALATGLAAALLAAGLAVDSGAVVAAVVVLSASTAALVRRMEAISLLPVWSFVVIGLRPL